MNNKHKNIENIQCTHFDIIKVCAFIFALFKNDIDCIIIDIPLKETMPVARISDEGVADSDKIFAPLVTSSKP